MCPLFAFFFLENVSEQMKGQGSEVQEGHKAILDDLAEVRGRAQDIYSKIGKTPFIPNVI